MIVRALLILLLGASSAAAATDVLELGAGNVDIVHRGDDNELNVYDLSRSTLVFAQERFSYAPTGVLRPETAVSANPAGLRADEPGARVWGRWGLYYVDWGSTAFVENETALQNYTLRAAAPVGESATLGAWAYLLGDNLSPNHPSYRFGRVESTWQALHSTALGASVALSRDDETNTGGIRASLGTSAQFTPWLRLAPVARYNRASREDENADGADAGLTMLLGASDAPWRAGLHAGLGRSEGPDEDYAEGMRLQSRMLGEIKTRWARIDLAARAVLAQVESRAGLRVSQTAGYHFGFGTGLTWRALTVQADMSWNERGEEIRVEGEPPFATDDHYRSRLFRLGLRYAVAIDRLRLVPAVGYSDLWKRNRVNGQRQPGNLTMFTAGLALERESWRVELAGQHTRWSQTPLSRPESAALLLSVEWRHDGTH